MVYASLKQLILDLTAKEITNFACMYCHQPIQYNTHNFHKDECYCGNCNEWMPERKSYVGKQLQIHYREMYRNREKIGWMNYILVAHISLVDDSLSILQDEAKFIHLDDILAINLHATDGSGHLELLWKKP